MHRLRNRLCRSQGTGACGVERRRTPRPQPPERTTALTELDTRDETWHAWRLDGLGGSDIASVIGESPYKSAYALWAEKVGFPADDHETEAMRFGRYAETMVACYVQDETGLWVGGQQTWLEHPDNGWMRATADGFIFEGPTADLADAIGILEIKCTGASADEWAAEIPLHIECQAQWLLAVSGHDRVYLAVFHMAFGRPKFRLYIVERDQASIDYLTTAGHHFWQLVLAGTPPELDGSESTTAALQRAWEGTRGAEVDVTPLADTFTDLRHAQAKAKAWTEIAAHIKNVVRAAMGDATEALVGGTLAATWRPTQEIDRAALLAELDDIELAEWSKFDLSGWAKKNVRRAKPFRTITGPRRFTLKGDE